MFGLKVLGLFPFVIIFSVGFNGVESVFSTPEKSDDESNESTNSREGHDPVEYSDYVEVPGFRKYEDGRFGYYSFVPDINIALKRETNSTFVINKCCGWDYYFDVDEFQCIPFPKNLKMRDFFWRKVKHARNDSEYLFTESIPDCGKESVIFARLTTKVSITLNGAIIDGKVYPKYCIDGNPKRPLEIVTLTCNNPLTFCKTHPCFRKCCPVGFSYVLPVRKCQKLNSPFKPKFYNLTTLTLVDSVSPLRFGVYLGDVCGAGEKYLLERSSGEDSYLGLEGKLLAPKIDSRPMPADNFCLEFIKWENDSGGMESYVCFSKSASYFDNSQLQFYLLSLGLIISCMFLVLTFLVYLFLPKPQNLYEKSLMCYIACLFTAYLCLAVIQLKSSDVDESLCTNLGYSLLFSFLAAFFWLNVMSFDIWKTFRLDRTVNRSKTVEERRRFFRYSLYAWSVPSAITAACAFVNQVQYVPFDVIKPNIGEEHCWFSRKAKGIYVFFIAPISLIITFNIFFYVQTAWKIWKVKTDVKKMEGQRKRKFSVNKDQFIINGKLFIVMGITWSLEVISFFAPLPIWYITDTANALHGVFIFAVFVMKKKVLHQVSQQVRAALKRTRQLTTSNSDDLSTRKNFQDLNTEGKTYETGESPRLETVLKSASF